MLHVARLAPAAGPLFVCLYVVKTTHLAVLHGVSAPGKAPAVLCFYFRWSLAACGAIADRLVC